MPEDLHDLGVLVDSSARLVLAEATEEDRCLAAIRAVARHRGLAMWTWSSVRGLVRDGGSAQYGTDDPAKALAAIADLPAGAVHVLADAHHHLKEPSLVRLLKETVDGLGPRTTIVVTAPVHEVPPELEAVATVWRQRPPAKAALEQLVRDTKADLRAAGHAVDLGVGGIERMANALRGLPLARAERLLRTEAVTDGRLDASDVARVHAARAALFADDGVLELVDADGPSLAELSGIDALTDWLTLRGRVVLEPVAGLPAPRGVLLTGVPGCGKSAVAKATAAAWGLPLVLLDPGRLFDKWVGSTEARLRRALDAVEAMAPAVLWVDEVEKGFAGAGDHDGGVGRRVLGTFLRWLQDRPDGVFLLATANDVSSLPPELFRRGRIDETFFLDLPDRAARRAILATHLRRRGHDPDLFPLDDLADTTEGYSGAELESAVVAGMYRALDGPGRLSPSVLESELAALVPLSVARAEEVADLRRWADGRARSAAAVVAPV